MQFLESVFADRAVVVDGLHLEQAADGGEADRFERRQILQCPPDAEAGGIVDRGFGAQRPAFLVGDMLSKLA